MGASAIESRLGVICFMVGNQIQIFKRHFSFKDTSIGYQLGNLVRKVGYEEPVWFSQGC